MDANYTFHRPPFIWKQLSAIFYLHAIDMMPIGTVYFPSVFTSVIKTGL